MIFIFTDQSSGQKSVILSNDDLHIVRETVKSENKALINLEAVENSDELITIQHEDSGAASDNDTEVLHKDDSDEF